MPNLSRCAMVDRRVNITYARIDCAADLFALRLCFGEVFGVGLPKRSGRPSRTNPTTYAHRGDNVNILHLSDGNDDDVMDDVVDNTFRERTAARGIDFYYDEAAGTLRLRIRYSSLVVSDEVVQQVLPGAGIGVAGDLNNNSPFRVGTLFVVDGLIHQIMKHHVATNMVELHRGGPTNNDNNQVTIFRHETWVETKLNAANNE